MTLGLCGYNFFLLNNKSYTTGICYRDTDKSTFTFIKQFKLEDKLLFTSQNHYFALQAHSFLHNC